MPFDILQTIFAHPPAIQPVSLASCDVNSSIRLSVLRLDTIHPVISGNKLFKLKEYLKEACLTNHRTLLTFGGAFSNHLSATAYATKLAGIRSIGLVRGEESETNSHTIAFCKEQGMAIYFLDRKTFRQLSENPDESYLNKSFGPHLTVPSGGFGVKGAMGAADILRLIPRHQFTHLAVAVGSATTLAGLLMGSRQEKILAFPALKGLHDIPERLEKMGIPLSGIDKTIIIDKYHFGGFAKKNERLIQFLNNFYDENKISLDFVYTGKMMYGIEELISQRFIPSGSHILAIHTGGLQGNLSLPPATLHY